MKVNNEKLLIVAHPDDEILWFNPLLFDKIIICFPFRRIETKRNEFNQKIFNAYQKHPLKSKIEILGLTSGEYWRNPSELEKFFLETNEKSLKLLLKEEIKNSSKIYTHNEIGEYGHSDHQLIYKVVKEMAKCPLYCWNGIKPFFTGPTFKEEMDINFFQKIKKIYKDEEIWTWQDNYRPLLRQSYFQIN